ncbi:MAG: DUF72 domain-containing protein [Desulfofustis sp.]
MHIGTCSWKYDSWRGLIYPETGPINYLASYSKHYRTVEVDQWFWSLFGKDTAVLPKHRVVREYAESVPEDFLFCVKVPNSISLTHHYKQNRNEPLRQNPHFLSAELMERFLEVLEPIRDRLGPLIFQFEYLNTQKMSGLAEFIDRFGWFAERLPHGFIYTVEIRNPNYLKRAYFEFLSDIGFHHVFLQGYYMPPIFPLYDRFNGLIHDRSVIRLLGSERQKIEQQTGKSWNSIVHPRNNEISRLADMLTELHERSVETFLYVNNHFEGSAPHTISKIEETLAAQSSRS